MGRPVMNFQIIHCGGCWSCSRYWLHTFIQMSVFSDSSKLDKVLQCLPWWRERGTLHAWLLWWSPSLWRRTTSWTDLRSPWHLARFPACVENKKKYTNTFIENQRKTMYFNDIINSRRIKSSNVICLSEIPENSNDSFLSWIKIFQHTSKKVLFGAEPD